MLQLPLPQRLAGLVHIVEQQLTILVIVLFATMLHQYLQVDSSLLLQHLPVDSSLRPQCFPVGSSLPLQHLPPDNSLPLQEEQTMCHPPAMHLIVHSAGRGIVHTLTAANAVMPTIVPSTAPPGVGLLNKPKPLSPIRPFILERELSLHPDQTFVLQLLNDLCQGCTISYTGPQFFLLDEQFIFRISVP